MYAQSFCPVVHPLPFLTISCFVIILARQNTIYQTIVEVHVYYNIISILKYIKIMLKYLEINYWGFRSSWIWSLKFQAYLFKMMILHSY